MVPVCPFIKAFIRRHPAYADLSAAMNRPLAARRLGAGVEIAPALLQFINDEAVPGTGIEPGAFWTGLVSAIARARAAQRRAARQAR